MKVSIIVPVYNVEAYLPRCLDSLLGQTLPDVQIIAIDDGSTDSSGRILDAYGQQHPGLQVLHQQNRGIGATRNRGIDLAQGQYITFVDSDDYLDPDFCRRLLERAEADGLDIAVCDFYETDGRSHSCKQLPDFSRCTVYEQPSLLFDINTSPWGKLYRRELLLAQQARFPEDLKYEDALFFQQLLAAGAVLGKVNAPLIYYYIRPGSETAVVRPSVFDIFAILDGICQAYRARPAREYEKIREYLEYFVINRMTVYNLQQVRQEQADQVAPFIDRSFAYLQAQFPDWRRNPHFDRANGPAKKLIKKSQTVTRLYVWTMRKLRK